jgi:uncharacterized membrane protein YbaN (DUF454 family)
MTRPFWFVVGVACLATGAAGIVLPLLPATPFLLLAAYAFARSSPRMHAWLLAHPRFGPVIDDWRRHGAIARNTKIAALALMVATLALSVALAVPAWVLVVQAMALAGSGLFIVTRPDRPRGPDQQA